MNDQFILSYELLQLLRWLVEYEPEALRRLVGKSMAKGLAEQLLQPPQKFEFDSEVQQRVIDFFSLLEIVLYESMQETGIEKGVQRALIPAINLIDRNICDAILLAESVNEATSAIEENPFQDPKEILCKELLKRWKPAK